MARTATAVAIKPAMKRILVNRLAKASTGKAAIKLASRTSGVALVGDATQAAAELAAMSVGITSQAARKIGFGAGATSSAAAGLVIGGPLGGAASLGFWLTAQLIADQAVAKAKWLFNRLVTS